MRVVKKFTISFFTLIFCLCINSYIQSHPWTIRYKKTFDKLLLPQKKLLNNNSSIIFKKKTVPFSQLIFSWNAFRRLNGFLRFSVCVRDNKHKKWLSWHKMIEWGKGVQRSFDSQSSDGSNGNFVRLDLTNKLADAFEIKIESVDGYNLKDFKNIYITISRPDKILPEKISSNKKNLSSIHIKNVPQISQMVLDHPDFSRICSPISTSMLVSYFLSKKINPIDFANNVYDDGLKVYGSWPFNTAYAFEICNGKINFFITRLNSFTELHTLLTKKIPIVVSIRGKINNAPKPYPSGHLLIIVGYNSKKKAVLCHDPANATDLETFEEYSLYDFLPAWELSHRLAYIADKNNLGTKSLNIKTLN